MHMALFCFVLQLLDYHFLMDTFDPILPNAQGWVTGQ